MLGRIAFPGSDLFNTLFLAALVFALHFFGIGTLEFFRHTEADRTLIAWEMSETGQYLVPHLLQSPILTKPPLYYWLLAQLISFFGPPTELLARMPSFAAALLFVVAQYCFLRLVRCSRMFSLLSAIFLASSVSFIILSRVAEIDMLFGLVCTVVLYCGYLSTVRASFVWTLAAYTAFAVAFLIKGPPVFFFFAAAHLLFYALAAWIIPVSGKPYTLLRFLAYNTVGAIAALSLLLLWLAPLAGEVGWHVLYRHFRIEVLERVVEDLRHERGPFFYLSELPLALLPASIFLFAGAAKALFGKNDGKELFKEAPYSFFLFNLAGGLAALIMLSLASGKTTRYIFPVHALFINLCTYGCLSIRGTRYAEVLFTAGKWIAAIALPLCVLLPWLPVPGVGWPALLQAAVIFSLPLFVLFRACRRREAKGALAALILAVMAVRFSEVKIYAPHRNATRSVKEAAAAVDRQMPPGVPVYTVEMFERWVSFYLKHLKRETIRLTPENALRPEISEDGRAYVLLNAEEEYWRLQQISFYDQTATVKGVFKGGKEHFILVELAPSVLPYFDPDEHFPTSPSRPFKKEAQRFG